MYSTLPAPRSNSPSNNMVAIRTPHDPYRSLPGTPIGAGPRGLTSTDLVPTLDHARSLIQPNGDYFSSPTARYGPSVRPRSPYPGIMEYDSDGSFPGAPYTTPEHNADNVAHHVYR